MKAILVSAAFLIPALVLANDPSMHGAMTPAGLLNKLHQTSQKSIEKGTVAQTNAGSEKVKSFGAKMVKDFQKLDSQVVDLAKEKNIVLATTAAYGSEETATSESMKSGAPKGEEMGNVPAEPGEARAGAEPMPSDSPSKTGKMEPYKADTAKPGEMAEAKGSDYQAEQAKWDRLKTLRGAEFDTEFLTLTVDGAKQHIKSLEGSRIKGEKKLDRLIDRAVKVFKDEQRDAEKLQKELMRAS